MTTPRVLVTGASGYVGALLVASLAGPRGKGREPACIVATDVREVPAARRLPGVAYAVADVRDADYAALLREHDVDTVVHLAAIVTPGAGSSRELEHAVDVRGTQRVLQACVDTGVRRFVVTSSGAAYGYHADNPAWITEDQPLRGNPEFAYADHKRQVEEMLARCRAEHPALEQVVLRVGTILGDSTRNQITALFEKPRLIAVRGSPSPFVFVWDRDVVGAIEHAIFGGPPGVYNLAGDGAMTIDEIAALLGKRLLVVPASLLKAALGVLHALKLSRYGPEQVNFLRYRPVLDNRRLKERFGYRPLLSSAQVFDRFVHARGLGKRR